MFKLRRTMSQEALGKRALHKLGNSFNITQTNTVTDIVLIALSPLQTL